MKRTRVIAYVGNFGFPDKNASGKRVLGNCKVLQDLGCKVICIGPGEGNRIEYDGITLYSINRGNDIERVIKNKLIEVQSILSKKKVEYVFLYGALFTQKENYRLITWCHKKGIKVIYDQVDWLDINWRNPLRGLIRTRNHYLMNNKVIPACDGVICISSFLANYHAKNGLKTVIIPPLSLEKSKHFDAEPVKERPLRLIYAGTTSDKHRPTAQWKDRIDIMLEVLADASDNSALHQFNIEIYGMTQEQYIDMFPTDEQAKAKLTVNKLGKRLTFHGITPNNEIVTEIQKADFTILIRDRKRATMAGFPTKISESIGCGTPILSNDTSDIKGYIINGETGYVNNNLHELISTALSMRVSDIITMKNNCHENPFYYKNFETILKEFLGW